MFSWIVKVVVTDLEGDWLTFVLTLGGAQEGAGHEALAAVGAPNVEPVLVVLVEHRHELTSVDPDVSLLLNKQTSQSQILNLPP